MICFVMTVSRWYLVCLCLGGIVFVYSLKTQGNWDLVLFMFRRDCVCLQFEDTRELVSELFMVTRNCV